MASPFSIFRRHKSVLLPIVGVSAMIAFVFITPIMQYSSSDSRERASTQTIVETNFGSWNGPALAAAVRTRDLVRSFLQGLARAVVESAIERGDLDAPEAGRAEQYLVLSWNQELMQRFHSDPQEAAIETQILASKAREMGMVVSDQAIVDNLIRITENRVSRPKMNSILGSLQTDNRRVARSRMYDALRTEMLASRVSLLFRVALVPTCPPPGERWKYFRRVSQQATIEAVPYDVSSFVDKVPEPSDEVLTGFFEKYRERLEVAGSPEPGFRLPHRATFQYFKADYDQFVRDATASEKEIKDFYEENKGTMFRAIHLPEETDSKTPAKGATEPELPTEPEPAAEETKPTSGDEKKPPVTAPAKPPAAPEGTAAPPAKRPAAAPSTPATTPAPADKKVPANAEKPAPAERPKGAQHQRGFKVLFASGPAARAKTPAVTPTTTTPAPTADKPAAPASIDKQPAADKSPAEKPTSDTPSSGTPSAEKPPADKAADAGKDAKHEEPLYSPLEKVRDDVIRALKGQKAVVEMENRLAKLNAEMRSYSSARALYEARHERDPSAPAPRLPDFAALAKANGVGTITTDLVSAPEVRRRYDLGQSYRVAEGRSGRSGRIEFPEMAYNENLHTFHAAEITHDDDNNYYLFWKINDAPEEVPTLAQVRQRVARAWRMIRARELALKQAKEDAAAARRAGKPLKNSLPEYQAKIRKPAPFSWMTTGNVPADPSVRPHLSEVEGLPDVGEPFMKAVFGLEPGGIDVAMNDPQTMVYLVRLDSFQPEADDLEADFAVTDYRKYLPVAASDQQTVYAHWLADLEREFNLRWLRPPVRMARRDDSGF